MNAIIVTGGKQYKVSEGDVVFIEKLDQNAAPQGEQPGANPGAQPGGNDDGVVDADYEEVKVAN